MWDTMPRYAGSGVYAFFTMASTSLQIASVTSFVLADPPMSLVLMPRSETFSIASIN